jgi:hypothetical protein
MAHRQITTQLVEHLLERGALRLKASLEGSAVDAQAPCNCVDARLAVRERIAHDAANPSREPERLRQALLQLVRADLQERSEIRVGGANGEVEIRAWKCDLVHRRGVGELATEDAPRLGIIGRTRVAERNVTRDEWTIRRAAYDQEQGREAELNCVPRRPKCHLRRLEGNSNLVSGLQPAGDDRLGDEPLVTQGKAQPVSDCRSGSHNVTDHPQCTGRLGAAGHAEPEVVRVQDARQLVPDAPELVNGKPRVGVGELLGRDAEVRAEPCRLLSASDCLGENTPYDVDGNRG